MKKTYITSMPNHIGAFLKASSCFAALGINITRVSYNKAIDSHILFIDAEGSEEQLKKADIELEKIGYLGNDKNEGSIVLLEFCLKDVPGSVTDVLKIIDKFNFNISYISSQENGSGYQYFKMGLHVDDSEKLKVFLSEAGKLCRVRIIEYSGLEKFYDNSIFYNTYVAELSQIMGLSESVRQKLLVHVNLAMQTLDEQGLSPYRTFDSISKFAELLAESKGKNFEPRITEHKVAKNTVITIIEPPCGSNTMIINSLGEYLFVDSGYACYKAEMTEIFKKLIPDFDNVKKRIYITHADVDHCGLLPMFDEIIASAKSAKCLELEYLGENGYREQNPLHKPYIDICKTLTYYEPVSPKNVIVPWLDKEELTDPLTYIGEYDFGELHFKVYEGIGGHLKGETVLVDYSNRIAITGDVYVNMHGQTPKQAEYNKYAPILMTTVDTDVNLCAAERKALMELLGKGEWQIFGAHGIKKDYSM